MHIIAGIYKKRRIHTPKGDKTRPTSGMLREAVFNILQSRVAEADFLDLFAGSGAMGFEALSRGARAATFVDESQDAVRCMQRTAVELETGRQAEILKGDVIKRISRLTQEGRSFDIIYIDPPYAVAGAPGAPLSLQALQAIARGNLLKPEGILLIEEGAQLMERMPSIEGLALVNTRRFGRSMLFEYVMEN